MTNEKETQQQRIKAAMQYADSKGTSVLREIFVERERQDKKWGGPKHDDQHAITVWRDLIRQRTDRIPSELFADRQCLIEIAALAVAAVQSIDRKMNRR